MMTTKPRRDEGTLHMTTITAIDPRTARPLAPVQAESTTAEVDDAVRRAVTTARALAATDRARRARLLEGIADLAEARRTDLVNLACAETGFTTAKLDGELTRAAFQFRFFADVIREGSYLEAIIDRPGATPMGPRPDLRRMLTPLGPVAVFGASNFPFAFSVLGGDTASALAAGCPVVVKAHDSHPGTSQRSFEVLDDAGARDGLDGIAGIVYGQQAGAELVAHDGVRAVGFTGSLSGGRALLDVIGRRDDPIPFYGELSSINPIVITPGAAAARGEQLGADLVGSVTLGAGQLCTKPGLVLVPDTADGERVARAARQALLSVDAQPLLNERIHRAYRDEVGALSANPAVTLAPGPTTAAEGFWAEALLVETDLDALAGDLVHETFGPVTILARYDASDVSGAAAAAMAALPASLTATIHYETSEAELAAELTAVVSPCAGRIIYNGFPTGVAVAWAQHHGGPWPSTNTLHTSVGATAIRRFLRPVTYQNAPDSVLPEELRDSYDAIPRRIDGVLHTGSAR
jgi:NADP-dependent aldehyde dehydrogenase